MGVGKVSVVIPAFNEGENLVDTVHCILNNSAQQDLEVIVVDDGSTDGSGDRVERTFVEDGRVSVVRGVEQGVAGARNLGASGATGEVLVFLDGHCYTPPGCIASLTAILENPEVGMVGPAFASLGHGKGPRGLGVTWRDCSLEIQWLPQQGKTPYPVPLLIGACQAMRREDFGTLGRYDQGMTRWGSEDLEMCLRVWLMGYRVLVQPQTVVFHLFRKRHPYEVSGAKILYNQLRMVLLHMSTDRIARVFDYCKAKPEFSRSRRRFQIRRHYDDDWFFSRFSCHI
ncbi:MAG: glycosyltransferase, partial [Deltaproteobacteria bacterium]